MNFRSVVRTRGMDHPQSDNLPPELDELGKRMSMESPVASDRALDRVMTRAQGARRTRKSSLLWRSSAPRAGRKSIAVAVAGVLAMAGLTGMTVMSATANHEPGHIDSPVDEADCPGGVIQAEVILGELVQACVVVLPFDPDSNATCPPGAVQIDVDLDALTQTCATALIGEDNIIDVPIGGGGGGGGGNPLGDLLDGLGGGLGGLGGG
ncbi:MAG TPA: hypothetical protein VGV90_15095 [Solirubrobacteraceae bacterium]|nr:hypothetical protein [Solirubrobacteraceae bacterium]